MDKLEKCIKDYFIEEALEVENESENESIEISDEPSKERILRKITQNVEI